MKRFLSVLTILVFVFGMATLAQAESEIMPRDSAFFSSYGTTLSRQGGGTIKIVFTANGMGICNTLGVATYEVERLYDEVHWEDCSGLLDGQTGSNVGSYTFSRYFYGMPGEVYRVKVTFTCVIDGEVEHKSYTSGRIEA